MAPFEALYGQKCRSPIGWLKVGERKLLGPKLVQDAIEKIRVIHQRMLSAQSRQKSYADNRWRDLEFRVGIMYFLRSHQQKRKYNPDPSHIIRYETIQLRDDLTYEEQPMAILDRQVKKLYSEDVASVKVLWQNHTSEEIRRQLKLRLRSPRRFFSLGPWMVGGDFNAIVSVAERLNGAPPYGGSMEDFATMLLDCGLLDAGFEGKNFT
ncbi:PREDICTED: uncharacterized protein LOC108661563 [Theobroma cacao]|uniref:Uncharacterized protein LOC108661563 n=1 Tax=Theobroma cacao TaxID=3641 RepID=A0AB32W507_THECC|nr:PREDICTED: uncharacterized protein LOC108661563 [Theobroma cacao]